MGVSKVVKVPSDEFGSHSDHHADRPIRNQTIAQQTMNGFS